MAHALSGPVLRDTARLSQRYPPHCTLWGFWCLNMANWVRYPPPPFLSFSPLESMRSRGAIPPPQKGYLSDTGAIPYENKANGRDTPLCDSISKRCCAIGGGGVSRTGPLSSRGPPQRLALSGLGRPLMHHQKIQNVPQQNAPSKRTLFDLFSEVPCGTHSSSDLVWVVGGSSCLLEWFRKGPLKRGQKSTFFRESETTIKIKFAFSGVGGQGGREENCPKRYLFVGKRHDNNILKVNILLSRNFVVMAQAPSFDGAFYCGTF